MSHKQNTDLNKTENNEKKAGNAESLANEEIVTRKDRKRQKRQTKRKFRVRLIPIWLRLLIILVLLVMSLIAGAMVGYGVIGNGDPMDVFEKETWQHIIDIIYKGTN